MGIRILKHRLSDEEQRWLAHNIGEREYFLHTGTGSHHWRWFSTSEGYYLEIDDDKIATMFILKFGQATYDK